MSKVTAERHGNRIWLTGGSYTDSGRCKSVPGASAAYQGDRFSHWTYPLSWNTCITLRRVFKDRLVVGIELGKWARAERLRREEAVRVARRAEFDLPAVAERAPRLGAAMAARTYQQVGSAFLTTVRRGVIADEPGLGKTLQIMGAMVEAEVTGPILVLAPSAAVAATWPEEIRQWLPGDSVHVCVGNRKQRERMIDAFLATVRAWPNERHWLIANFEMVRAHPGHPKISKVCPEPGPFTWEHTDKNSGKKYKGNWHHPYAKLFRGKWSAIIADESQRALVTKTPVRMDQTQVRAGIGLLQLRDDGFKIAASGTPFRGKLENFWGTLNWIDPVTYSAYWTWVNSYFEVYQDEHAMVIAGLDPDREKDFYGDLDTIMIRRKKSEVAKDLPPKMYPGSPADPTDPDSLHGIWLEMSDEQKKFYHQMVEQAILNMESGQLIANGVLAEMTRLKQIASSGGTLVTKTRKVKYFDRKTQTEKTKIEEYQTLDPRLPSNKFDWLVNWLDERDMLTGESDQKVVVASQFTGLINLFRRELLAQYGLDSHVLTGETKTSDRVRAKAEFQAEGGKKVFFLNTDAGGVSLTLDAADDLIFLDEKWIPDDQTQVEDRIHRVSRMHQVRIWYLRSRGTIEERIGMVNVDRDQMQLMILDGRRGVDFAKMLLGAA